MGYTLAGDLCTVEDADNGDLSVPWHQASSWEEDVFDGVPLPLQETVKILGAEVDWKLRFDGHNKHIAQKASHEVTALRRVTAFLDEEGRYGFTWNMLPFRRYRVQPRTPGNWTASSVEPYDLWILQTPHPNLSQRVPLTHWNTARTSRC